MSDRIDDVWHEIRALREAVEGYREEDRARQDTTDKQIRRLSHESSATKELVYRHLEDHSIDPEHVGCRTGAWDPEKYDPLVATERMQLRRHRGRVLTLLLVLLGAVIPRARPWVEQVLGAIR